MFLPRARLLFYCPAARTRVNASHGRRERCCRWESRRKLHHLEGVMVGVRSNGESRSDLHRRGRFADAEQPSPGALCPIAFPIKRWTITRRSSASIVPNCRDRSHVRDRLHSSLSRHRIFYYFLYPSIATLSRRRFDSFVRFSTRSSRYLYSPQIIPVFFCSFIFIFVSCFFSAAASERSVFCRVHHYYCFNLFCFLIEKGFLFNESRFTCEGSYIVKNVEQCCFGVRPKLHNWKRYRWRSRGRTLVYMTRPRNPKLYKFWVAIFYNKFCSTFRSFQLKELCNTHFLINQRGFS